MLSAVTTFSACLRRQVVYLVRGCMLSMCVCVCMPDVLVCGMFGCFTTKHYFNRTVTQKITLLSLESGCG